MPASRSFPLSSANSQASPFYKKHKMSLTQTYYLAHTARSKLSKEAGRPEYDLRVLVGHANLLDGLMVELADAEREQESWFNQSIRKAESTTPATKSAPSHISWADSLPPVVEDDSSDDESSEDDDEDMIDAEEPVAVRKRAPTPPASSYTAMDLDSESDEEDDIAEDDDSDSDELALTRTSSRSSLPSPSETPDSPPELCDELSDSEDEESNTPPSPPTEVFHLDSKHQEEQLKGAEDWTVVPSQPGIYA